MYLERVHPVFLTIHIVVLAWSEIGTQPLIAYLSILKNPSDLSSDDRDSYFMDKFKSKPEDKVLVIPMMSLDPNCWCLFLGRR